MNFFFSLNVGEIRLVSRNVSGYLKKNLETSTASKHVGHLILPAHKHGHGTEIQKHKKILKTCIAVCPFHKKKNWGYRYTLTVFFKSLYQTNGKNKDTYMYCRSW